MRSLPNSDAHEIDCKMEDVGTRAQVARYNISIAIRMDVNATLTGSQNVFRHFEA